MEEFDQLKKVSLKLASIRKNNKLISKIKKIKKSRENLLKILELFDIESQNIILFTIGKKMINRIFYQLEQQGVTSETMGRYRFFYDCYLEEKEKGNFI